MGWHWLLIFPTTHHELNLVFVYQTVESGENERANEGESLTESLSSSANLVVVQWVVGGG